MKKFILLFLIILNVSIKAETIISENIQSGTPASLEVLITSSVTDSFFYLIDTKISNQDAGSSVIYNLGEIDSLKGCDSTDLATLSQLPSFSCDDTNINSDGTMLFTMNFSSQAEIGGSSNLEATYQVAISGKRGDTTVGSIDDALLFASITEKTNNNEFVSTVNGLGSGSQLYGYDVIGGVDRLDGNYDLIFKAPVKGANAVDEVNVTIDVSFALQI
jgi:hypothetical protein